MGDLFVNTGKFSRFFCHRFGFTVHTEKYICRNRITEQKNILRNIPDLVSEIGQVKILEILYHPYEWFPWSDHKTEEATVLK